MKIEAVAIAAQRTKPKQTKQTNQDGITMAYRLLCGLSKNHMELKLSHSRRT